MSLEQKIQTGERSLLKRFLHSAKSKVLTSALGLAMLTPLACDGRHRTPAPGPVNNAPVITTTAPTSGLEGSLYNYDVDATDADGDAISYSLDTAPLWASINATSGLITGTPTDSGANRTDNFGVRATDSKGASSVQNFGVNVTNLGSVSGTVVDIDGNPLLNKIVDLYNSTFLQGTYTGTTLSDGSFVINNVPNRNDWNFEIGDGYTGIFKFRQPNYTTSGNSMTTAQPQMILMHSIASTGGTNNAYLDSLGNTSFLQLFKYDTVLRPSDSPSGGPHSTTSWPTVVSNPINVFYNIAAAPATDLDLNGVPDVVDSARVAVANWATQIGISNLTTEVTTMPSQGIRFVWTTTNSITGLTYNTDGTYQRATLNINTSQPASSIAKDEEHELGHALYCNRHSDDGIYIMATPSTATGAHADEGKVAKYNLKLPHRTNIDWYVDQ